MNQPARAPSSSRSAAVGTAALARRFEQVRQQTQRLTACLSEADCQVQSMPDTSPAKWHLAHVTWFFETFVLERFEPGFKPHHPAYRVLFNSYYQGVGEQHPRPQRGLITRPGLAEVMAYRGAVEQRVLALLQHVGSAAPAELLQLIEIGLQHEQQHQELLLTDVLHMLSCNPLAPAYRPRWPLAPVQPLALDWVELAGGLIDIGHGSGDGFGDGQEDGQRPESGAEPGRAHGGFAFDNEGPRHATFLRPYALANRLTTHGEWAQFIADGGYRNPRWWLAAGWDWLRAGNVEAPLYWRRSSGGDQGADQAQDWHSFTLHGLVPIDPHTPVTHISLYEADAYARWAGAQHGQDWRLPGEAEWEHAAEPHAAEGIAAGNFVETQALHPVPVARARPGLLQLYGDVWEWTRSSYGPYPGFRAWEGAAGEYNGKFMLDQTVLRGGSCVTPRSHMRATYRNFFPAPARWQFNGLRLARDL